MNEAILFTSGSSPSDQKSYTSSTIAIMDINLVQKKEVLYCKSNKVSKSMFECSPVQRNLINDEILLYEALLL